MPAALALLLLPLAAGGPVVEVEDEVYAYANPGNGAGPMWCFGSSCLVRVGERVFVSCSETIEGAKPLNNVCWSLRVREGDGWRLVHRDEIGRTREPSPLALLGDDLLLLSANPTLTPPDTYNGAAEPCLFAFDLDDLRTAPERVLPTWEGTPAFTEHSYRTFASDGPNREALLLQNIGYEHAEWSFLDRTGQWSRAGRIVWPWGAEYAQPEAIRLCYPTVALRDRALHFAGVSDIIEPNPQWRAAKREITGQEWDYDFRRLFYASTPDIGRQPFSEWLEIASREATCGWISPCDLRLDERGRAWVLWLERALDERLRERFYPAEKQRHALECAIVEGGRIVARQTLLQWREGEGGIVPGRGRFHETPDGGVHVVCWASGEDAEGRPFAGNRLLTLGGEAAVLSDVPIPLAHPMGSFFTATPRAGCAPSWTLDMLGEAGDCPGTLRYARVRLGP